MPHLLQAAPSTPTDFSSALQPIDDIVTGLSNFGLGLAADLEKLLLIALIVAAIAGALVYLWGGVHQGHAHHGGKMLKRAGVVLALVMVGLPVMFHFFQQKYGITIPASAGSGFAGFR
jgi:hypothetical protein